VQSPEDLVVKGFQPSDQSPEDLVVKGFQPSDQSKG